MLEAQRAGLQATVEQAFQAFQIPGTFLSAEPHGAGHINETFMVRVQREHRVERHLFQRLNTRIFKAPATVMESIERVTTHIRSRLQTSGSPDAARRVLTLHRTLAGACFLDDPDLGFWRAYLFIDGAQSCDRLETVEQAFQAARSFGRFQHHLADFAGPRLPETIPFFHHTVRRFEAFRRAVQADPLGRATGAEADIAFALEHEALASRLLELARTGDIPERITHNDTKLSNVLLDEATGEGVCVVDLDTVMPGLSLYDFGDLVRSACNPVAEDAVDASQVIARAEVFEALAAGYLEGTAGSLLPVEREHLGVAGELLTYECGLRFLTDYLEGDTYFRIHRPNHNLDRCRTQFALLRSLERQADEFMKCIRTL